MQLAVALKTIRQKAFMTQDCFAKELCVTVSTVNRWEHRKAKPNLKAMKKLKSFCKKHDLSYEVIESAWFDAQNNKWGN